MEQNQSNPQIPKLYKPPTSIPLAYPPFSYYDTMATNYVHSNTSSPCYVFLPHYPCANDYNSHHPHHAYPIPPLVQAPMTNSPIPTPHANSLQCYCYIPPNKLTHDLVNYQQYSQGINPCQPTQAGNPQEGSEEVREKEKSIDPRIINILEPFRQLYSEQEESLKSVFPGIHSKLSEFFKKVNSLILEATNAKEEEGSKPRKSLRRSLSLGSSNCKNERFKVRPIDSEETAVISPEGKRGLKNKFTIDVQWVHQKAKMQIMIDV
ncbi:hypothetical protein Cgig2_006889 [Carnegiea gigantea]|uniref:Uncharacterized protein n=1 Tax=Carnegiea gigantea TaxID=171969 RepID=A0A9Q1K4G9_9CARY|nr:hypothetical protein Cgig2_006889 [Carnegiea gigantea]